MLRVHNTASRLKEEFAPLNPGQVGVYVCGVTVYDRCHIGHARSVVVFDTIIRHLEWRGFKVKYVRNFTDVDDKIINRAQEEGVECAAIAERYIAAFKEDMGSLNLRRPDVEPRATAHISDIIAAIQGLVDKGVAYEAAGDVYFSVSDFEPYGRLSQRKLDDLKAGARVEVGESKRNPLDFALWKRSKPGEPAWESPWGLGRPGWHIECSVMSTKYLGPHFDIHGGGEDLIFPHHENEKAQAEALNGQPFVNYWLHNGFVRLNSEKMSKSLGNFLTIEEILKRHHPEVLRLFLLSAHYRSPLDYSEEAMSEADEGLGRLYEAWGRSEEVLKAVSAASAEGPLTGAAEEARRSFKEAMDNDFNSAQGLGQVFHLARRINRALEEEADLGGLGQAAATLVELSRILGLLGRSPAEFAQERRALLLARRGLDPQIIRAKVVQRTNARQSKDFAAADAIRDELSEMGVILFDSPEGTTWKIKD